MLKIEIDQKKVEELLPGKDCGMCGMTCSDFAAFLVTGELSPQDCPLLLEEENKERLEKLKEILWPISKKLQTGLIIFEDRCNGCGICLTVCEYNIANSPLASLGKGPSSEEKVVIRIEDGCIKLVHPELCIRSTQEAEKCAKCADACPMEAITFLGV